MTDLLAPGRTLDGRPVSTVHVSVFDLFSVGIGPSSSHTVGPMRAAARFRAALGDRLAEVTRWTCVLHGSLAATGVGHGTPDAVLAGLGGAEPETCDPAAVRGVWAAVIESGRAHPWQPRAAASRSTVRTWASSRSPGTTGTRTR
ncbi:serine dehydratase beta chain [Curtobacterium flaccumfaciens]|nr:serine dehydratase beta chain [Curtobacterium flaccumfaciens]